MADSEKPGHALDLICTDYLATNGAIDTVKEYLAKVEKQTGIRIMGYDMKNDVVVYGAELLDELEEVEEDSGGDSGGDSGDGGDDSGGDDSATDPA